MGVFGGVVDVRRRRYLWGGLSQTICPRVHMGRRDGDVGEFRNKYRNTPNTHKKWKRVLKLTTCCNYIQYKYTCFFQCSCFTFVTTFTQLSGQIWSHLGRQVRHYIPLGATGLGLSGPTSQPYPPSEKQFLHSVRGVRRYRAT